MEAVFLIDKQGRRISSENISSHIGLANLIIEKDEELKKEFERSGKYNPVEFLIEDKGWMAISDDNFYNREVTYDSEFISEEQKRWMQYYHEEGYHFTDFAMERRKLERGEY